MPAGERKCNYAKCERPEQSSLFYTIEKGKSGGGQDWSSLEGLVLCRNCYEHFHKRGTLERAYNRPLAESARHCTNAQCDKPELGRRFYQVVEGQKTGGQDWSSLVGSVLCNACYCRFTRRGTLDRSHNRPLVADNKKCTYTGCARPETTSCFHQIEHGKSTGGKDWSVIAGAVLCHTCYCRFRNTGTLDGGSRFPVRPQPSSLPSSPPPFPSLLSDACNLCKTSLSSNPSPVFWPRHHPRPPLLLLHLSPPCFNLCFHTPIIRLTY